MSQIFVPAGVQFDAIGIDGHSPTISFRDPLSTKDSLVVFQSRAAMLELSSALLAALQDYDVVQAVSAEEISVDLMDAELLANGIDIDGTADQVNYATDKIDYGAERFRSAERNV